MGSFNFLQNKKIGVFGLGITGVASYAAIRNAAKEIKVWDDKISNREEFALKFGPASLSYIESSEWESLDQILLSPGVQLDHRIRAIAKSNNIEIISDIDLLFDECKSAKFIGITGTNGKSTTTALIYHILKTAKKDFAMGGNIGVPALALPLDKKGYVLELSSFQLDLTKSFKSNIAVLLNVTPDHLDRYNSLEKYAAAKEKILSSLNSDGFGIIGVDNEITGKIFKKFSFNNSKIIPVSSQKNIDHGISVIGNKIFDNLQEPTSWDLPGNKSLQGNHNKENIAASVATCRLFGVGYQEILEAIKSFKGLPHRAEYLGIYENITFYNDSKATNADAASKSLSFLDNIYWLAGGVAKEGGINSLSPLFHKVRKAYLFGDAKNLFAETIKNKVEYEIFENLSQAFAQAVIDTQKDKSNNKNILLAPAAASTDQFKNFEHRGEKFRQLFNDLREVDE